MTAKRKPPQSDTLAPLASHPELKVALAAEGAIRDRIAQSEQRIAHAKARLAGAIPKKGALAIAKSLLAGNMIPGASPADEIAAANQELDTLGHLLRAKREETEQILGKVNYDAAEACRGEYSAALLAAFRAMEALHAAAVACRAIKIKLIAAGYAPSSIVLPDIGCRGALMLGDPSSFDTGRNEAAAFRRRLEALGISL
jgi:hypothetical protein